MRMKYTNICLSLEEEDIAKSVIFVNKQDNENDMNGDVFEFRGISESR